MGTPSRLFYGPGPLFRLFGGREVIDRVHICSRRAISRSPNGRANARFRSRRARPEMGPVPRFRRHARRNCQRPDAVVVNPGLLPVLERLQDRLDGALAVISGRPISFLDERLAPYRFDAAGFTVSNTASAGSFLRAGREDSPDLRREIARLRDVVASHPGMILEDKGCSVALHWRMAPDAEDFAQDLARATADTLGEDYRLQFGKAVAEILPAASGKGRIIESFLRETPYRGRSPIFVGDDLTDEHGFEW